MSAPATHDPVAVMTKDGASWVRRAVTQDGRGLYAVDGSCDCPEFLMATLAELAEHGIVGSAVVLPVPVGPELVTEVEQLRVRVAELVAERHTTNEALSDAAEKLRADRDRIAALEATPKTVFRASHDSIVMGHYTTREAARDHCQKLMERASAATLEWRPDGERREDDDGEPGPDEAEELYEYGTHESATWDPTGYVVTPVEVASKYDEDADE